MKLKRILCAALALILTLGAFGLVSCDNGGGNDKAPAPVYTLGNIRETISAYTIIRSYKAASLVINSVKLLRSTVEQTTGVKLDISQDWVEDPSTLDSTAREILVGDTNRPESKTAMAELSEQKPYAVTQVDNKICIVGLDEYNVRRATYEFLTVYFDYKVPNYNYHNVIDYGAEGDGVRDETESFRAAIKAAEADGLPVYVPAGKYVISNTIELHQVTLYGYHSGAWTADDSDLPVIVQTNPEVPVFNVVAGSLSGLLIDVKGVTKDMDITPAETVRLSNAGARVSNLRICNPYIGISTYYEPGATLNPGRCFIENIFMINVHDTGLYVHGTYDVATLCNIEVWNPNIAGNGKLTCPVAYKFGKNDDLRAVNLFAFNAKVGFLFEESEVGVGKFEGCWGSFTNCSTDLCETGLKIGKGQHALTVVGGTYWNHFYGLDVTNQTSAMTRVTMTGCELKTNGASAVNVSGGQMITVTGCNISRTQSDQKAIAVTIKGGSGVNLSGNTICANGKAAIEITISFKGAASVTGNTIITSQSSAENAISGKASDLIVIANNAVLTDYKYE